MAYRGGEDTERWARYRKPKFSWALQRFLEQENVNPSDAAPSTSAVLEELPLGLLRGSFGQICRTVRGRARAPSGGPKRPVLAVLNHEESGRLANPDSTATSENAASTTPVVPANYPPIIKNVYVEHPDVTKMMPAEADAFRKNSNEIVVKQPAGAPPPGASESHQVFVVPNPITKLEYAFINYPEIRMLLLLSGFEKPTPIQSQAWPLILRGEDVIGVSQDYTGKILAFLLPAYAHSRMQPTQQNACVLVLVPTLEVAVKVNTQAQTFNCAGLTVVMIHGGDDLKQQIRDLARGCSFIIGTPGRLNELIRSGDIDVSMVTFVVFYAANRMLCPDFQALLSKTMAYIRPDRQTIMVSAKWPNHMQAFANTYMRNPVQVMIGKLDLTAIKSCSLSFIFLEEDNVHRKLRLLSEFVKEHRNDPHMKVGVFSTGSYRAAYIACKLSMMDVKCFFIRDDLVLSESVRATRLIEMDEEQYVITTDVASCGINIPDLTHVIHLDFPLTVQEFVHRIGRVQLVGQQGNSLSYFTLEDAEHAEELIKVLEEAGQPVPSELREYMDKYELYIESLHTGQPLNICRYLGVDSNYL